MKTGVPYGLKGTRCWNCIRDCGIRESAHKVGPNLNAWVVSIVISLTVLISVSLGVVAAYGAVNGILLLFAGHTRLQADAQPVLMARNAQAGAD